MNIEQLVANYHPPAAAIELVRHTHMAFLSGVSGVGKDTIVNELLKNPDYQEIISHTTRPPRVEGGRVEVEGKDYYFIDLTTAAEMLSNQQFFEAKFVHGNVYGTSIAEIQRIHDRGKIAITDLDVQGVAAYKAVASNVQAIFILPPSDAEWQRRLLARGRISPDDLKKRLETSRFERAFAKKHHFFDYVINDDLAAAVRQVDQLIRRQP